MVELQFKGYMVIQNIKPSLSHHRRDRQDCFIH